MNINNHIERAKRLSVLLDNKFKILGFNFGIDPILDFIPGIGSIIGGITSAYIFWIALQIKVPTVIYFRMGFNILLDTILGEIPIVGAIFDAFYKSNIKNLKLLEPYVNTPIIDAELID